MDKEINKFIKRFGFTNTPAGDRMERALRALLLEAKES